MERTKNMVFTGLCIALGIILPITLHAIPNAGRVLLPMHIPVLLCGLLCGWPYGLICGFITPLLSSLFTGMPPMAMLPAMLCELAVYGFLSGALSQIIKTKNQIVEIYIALIGAMVIGRIVYGLLNAIIFQAGEYSLQIWLTGAFITGSIGILVQLIIIPLIVVALRKVQLVHYGQH